MLIKNLAQNVKWKTKNNLKALITLLLFVLISNASQFYFICSHSWKKISIPLIHREEEYWFS